MWSESITSELKGAKPINYKKVIKFSSHYKSRKNYIQIKTYSIGTFNSFELLVLYFQFFLKNVFIKTYKKIHQISFENKNV